MLNIGLVIVILAGTIFCVSMIAGDVIGDFTGTSDSSDYRLKVTFLSGGTTFYEDVQKYDVVNENAMTYDLHIHFKNGNVLPVSGVTSADYVSY